MTKAAPVSAVIIAYDSGDALEKSIASVYAAGARECIVIDNASRDEAVSRAERRWPALVVRRQTHNLGFAKASNLGGRLATQPYVLFLNDDALIEHDYLEILCRALQSHPNAAGAIGKLLARNEPAPRIDSAGIHLRPWSWSARDFGANEIDAGQYDTASTPFGVTGAAALYRRDVFVEQGGFDERLVSYYEDVDLAWRLSKAGFVHLYVPDAVAYHERRNLVGKERTIQERAHLNRYRVWFRHERKRRLLLLLPISLPREVFRATRLLLRDPKAAAELYKNVPSMVRAGWAERQAGTDAHRDKE